MEELNHSFGYWLRLQRKANDLTREGLAQLVFCSAETIRKIENEERRPSAQIVDRLADIFHIPVHERENFLRFARGSAPRPPKLIIQPPPWMQKDQIPKDLIPIPSTTFIGREKEIKEIRGYLSDPDIRLISLIGSPGIGKTRLSLEIARLSRSDFSDGVFFISLDALANPNLLITTILSSLGYVGKTVGHTNQFLVDTIDQKNMLLILDNCEHLIETIALLVTNLLRCCANLNIICTSREALRIAGEWQYKISPLEMPVDISLVDIHTINNFPAIALFSVRAKSVSAEFSIQEQNAIDIYSICKKLDGLPLAIELIAPRIRYMSPKTLLDQITNQSVLFSNGMRGLPPRQKTLFNAILWSYQLLSETEQKLFRHLSVFSSGFTMDSATTTFQSVFPGVSIPNLVSSLIDKSLIRHAVDNQNNDRFSMLATIHQFSFDQLCHQKEDAFARTHHLHNFLRLAETGEMELRGPEQIAWINRLESELDNFRSALDWAISQNQIEAALRILGSLGWFWEIRGHYQEARNWFYQIRTNPNIQNYPIQYAKLLNHIGRYCWLQENICNAEELLNESKETSLLLGLEGEKNLVDTLNWLAVISILQNNDTEKAKAHLEQAFSILQNFNDQHALSMTTFHYGVLGLSLGQTDLALKNLQESYALFKNHGDLFFQSRTCIFLGYQALHAGQLDKAYQYFDENVKIDEALQFWDGIADGWCNFGNFYRQQNLFEQAFECYQKSISISDTHGLIKRDSFYLSGLTALHLDLFQMAEQHFKRVIGIDSKKGNLILLKFPLMGLAGAKDGLNQIEQAAVLMGITKLISEIASGDILPYEQLEFDPHFKNTSEKLGELNYDKFFKQGYSMTIEQAVDFALTV